MIASAKQDAMVDFKDSDDINESLDLENIFQTDPSARILSLDMWGSCRADNYHVKIQENQKLKPLCVHLLKLVADFLSKINVSYFIYGGTALAVYREGGKMIEHDGDIDIAILEGDFSCVVNNVSTFDSVKNGDVLMSDECSIYGTSWIDADGKEILYNGIGCKRVKFFATEKCLRQFGIEPEEHFDVGDVHLDVFTLGQHPDDKECLCVNWNIPGVYDYSKKRFPKTVFLPAKTYTFEGLVVTGPNNLQGYLEIEYGYLGRGAVYDNATGLYVKIPDNLFKQLPETVQAAMSTEG